MPIRVLASVITRGPCLLIAQRPLEKRHGGLWEFPGGKVEEGESDFEAVHRELREELAVEVTAVGAVNYSLQDPGSDFVINFLPVEIEGEPSCLEHSELRWASLEKILELPLAPSDLRFARFLQAQSRVEVNG